MPNSLGPRDSNGQPLGGNFLAAGSAAIIFPNPYMEKLRTSAFIDAGNVYTTSTNLSSQGPLRYSAGISADWRVPVFNFVIGISLAQPLNKQAGDKIETIQYNIGTNF